MDVVSARKAERQAAKQRLVAEREMHRRLEAEARVAAARREQEELSAQAYGHYRRVREWLRGGLAVTGATLGPLTPAEQQMVAALAPLWEAPPEAVAALRRWSGPITGVRPAEYEPPSRDLAWRLKYAVGRLRRHAGDDLFVEESPRLGGFGAEWHRQRFNEDTVRFFKAIVALHDGAVLGDCRSAATRRLVWEIGGGWGGFAFQFKTVCPNVTYLITGIPEQLLVSAVYLMTMFPEARVRFYDSSAGTTFWDGWDEVDFFFAPEGAVAALQPPEIHLTLDVLSLLRMTDARVARHVQRAFDLGSRYFFSQLPGPCFPRTLPATWHAIARWYWLHQIPPPLDAAAYMVERLDDVPAIDDYAQAVGWRRLRA